MNFELKSFWKYGREYCSLEQGLDAEGETFINILLSTKKNGEFDIGKTFGESSVESLKGKIKEGQHIFLNFSGSQVIIKPITTSGDDSKILNSAFPSLDRNNFYYQILKTPSINFVSICRKDYVTGVIKKYSNQNFNVIGFSLGFSSIKSILSVFQEKEIELSIYKITIEGGEVIHYEKTVPHKNGKNYLIQETSVGSNYLLPLAGLFSYTHQPAGTTSNFNEELKNLRKEFQEKVFFKKSLLIGTFILLGVLLINFFIFTSYYSKLQEISEKHQVEIFQNEIEKDKLGKLKDKESIVNNIFNNSNSKSVYYLNRIIAKKPGSIQLTEFTYQPLFSQIKENEEISLATNEIKISGSTIDEAEFSSWVELIQNFTWVKVVKVTDYSYESGNSSKFAINIQMEDNETAN